MRSAPTFQRVNEVLYDRVNYSPNKPNDGKHEEGRDVAVPQSSYRREGRDSWQSRSSERQHVAIVERKMDRFASVQAANRGSRMPSRRSGTTSKAALALHFALL